MTRIHFIGIGGTGLSAIAILLAELGYTVTGSDKIASPLAMKLAAQGIPVTIGHHPENISGADMIIRSSAVPDDNTEVVAGNQAGIPVLKRADFLGILMTDRYGIAVAGTHGKSTTTAMIAWILTNLGKDPSFIVGAVLNDLGVNARAGRGNHFVIEADEYDNMFLGLKPQAAIITSIDYDHPDFFRTPEEYLQAFQKFIATLPEQGLLLSCADHPGVRELLRQPLPQGIRGLTYSLRSTANYMAKGLVSGMLGGFRFDVTRDGKFLTRVDLQLPGEHNASNALAAISLADQIGLSPEASAEALSRFSGIGRRFELRGDVKGVKVIDDYAHHPTEIRATLSAARSRYPGKRIWALWQPHTFSRTQSLFDEFTRAFSQADKVLVTEVFAAREASQSFSSAQIVSAIRHPDTRFVQGLEEASLLLANELAPGDVLIVMSAGDANQVSDQVVKALDARKN